tara:strand:+ start:12 stop:494 length:483 start_codon:yes stop_codon:yes gene_type:complete
MLNGLLKIIRRDLVPFIAGLLIGTFIQVFFWYFFLSSENFSSDTPNSEEILKRPFYERISGDENTNDPTVKKLCMKAAALAEKDQSDLSEKLEKLLSSYVDKSLETAGLDPKSEANAKKAAREGTKTAIVAASTLLTKQKLTATPSPSGAAYAELDSDIM